MIHDNNDNNINNNMLLWCNMEFIIVKPIQIQCDAQRIPIKTMNSILSFVRMELSYMSSAGAFVMFS